MTLVHSLPHLSRFQVAAGVVLALLAVIGFLPLFAGPSYEYCLVAGVLLPGAGAIAAAGRAKAGTQSDAAWANVLGTGLGLSLVACGVGLAHGLRVGFCDLWGGLAYFCVGPAAGAVVGASWGNLVRAWFGRGTNDRTWLRIVVCLGLPLASIAISFGRFYTSPIIFAFDHFFGYFAGTLYDTEIDSLVRLAWYRVGSCGWVLAAVGLARLWGAGLGSAGLFNPAALRVLFQSRAALTATVAGLSLVGVMTAQGEALGHFQTDRSIRQALGHSLRFERCEVVYASGIPVRDADLLAHECEAHLRQHEAYFETRYAGDVAVFVFASADQKAQLMGARHVYIAKPWRHEIYIQSGGFPHPVLGHELAHVVAGAFGQGPFLVAGPGAGYIPDPGRIEGFAVAAAPQADDELSVLGWAAAMQRQGQLPPLQSLFRLSFFGENSSKAYTAAGAFVTWMHARFGAAALRSWYGGVSLEQATGQSLAALEAAYQAELATIQLSETELAVAAARFERPAIFGRRCPHEVDEITAAANQALAEFDVALAEQSYQRVLKLDADDFGAKVGLAQCAVRQGKLDVAAASFLGLGGTPVTQLQRASLTERAADAALMAGDGNKALQLYTQVSGWVVDEDQLRTLELKALAAAAKEGSPARLAIVALLLGEPTLGTNWLASGAALSNWANLEPGQGIASYLLGRNLFSQGRWEAAARSLDQAVSREISGAYTRREAFRLQLVVACATQDLAGAKRAYQRYMDEPNARTSRRFGVTRFAQRCGVPVTL